MTDAKRLNDKQAAKFKQAFMIEGRQSEAAYRSWIKSCEVRYCPESEILTISNTRFHISYLQNNFAGDLQRSAQVVFGDDCRIEYQAASGKRALRSLPDQDDQLDFFVPALAETALRDEIHLMEIAPFTLSRKESRTKIVYSNITGMDLTITCNPDHGMMTAHDYDFVLMMMSHLNEKANIWRMQRHHWLKTDKAGPEPEKPPREFKPATNDIIKFMRKQSRGGKTYKLIEEMLDRLANCTAKVERLGRRKRRAGTFNFLERYEVTSRTANGAIMEVRVTVPDWIYDGIVREDTPTLLTIDPDYVLINSPTGKFLYRLAKLKAGKENAEVPLAEVHMRSGSSQSLKAFNRDLKNYIDDLYDLEGTDRAFPDYLFKISGEARKRVLFIQRRDQYTVAA